MADDATLLPERVARASEQIQATCARIHALCETLEQLVDAGEIWWSWDDRRLHYRQRKS
jgi:hypothetical protein